MTAAKTDSAPDETSFTTLRPGEATAELPVDPDQAVYFIGRIRTPWRARRDCPKHGDPENGPVCRVEVDPREPFAANALAVGGALVFPAAFPATAERLARRGFALELVQLDELAKAEGAVTCCSLLFETTEPTGRGAESTPPQP